MTTTRAATTMPARSTEAAKLYRQAFEEMKGLSEADGKRLGLCGVDGCWVVTTPLDAAAADLVARQKHAIELARQAATLPATDWEINGDGERVVELANRAPRLAALLALNAREEFHAGRASDAIEDVVAAFALSRQAATEQTIMGKFAEALCWRPAADVLAQELPTLPKPLVASVPKRIRQMPESPTMPQIVHGEYAYAKKAAPKQGVTMTLMIASLSGFYDDIAAGASRPPDEFDRLVDEQIAKHLANPWAKVIGPSFKTSRRSIAVLEARQAMLETAIDVVLAGGNPAAVLARSKDPFGAGPFGYRKMSDGGFELSSGLQRDGEPVSLRVGSGGARNVNPK